MTGRLSAALRRGANTLVHRAEARVGGPGRLKTVLLLASVIALDGADKATVAVNAGAIESAFHVGHTGIGLLVSATALTGALCTLPAGVLVDRVWRTRLLAVSVLLWSVATVLAGVADSYLWLLLARIALGAVTATAGPAVASLMGDCFPAAERARVYGYVLAGEIVGTGAGYVISNYVTAILGWRYSFVWLFLPGVVIAGFLWRMREPRRGGAGRQENSKEDQAEGEAVPHGPPPSAAQPYREQVLHEDPARMPAPRAFRYVLRIRTVILMIVASALGYFFFAGLRTFALVYAMHHYGVSRAAAGILIIVVGIGLLAGLMAGARAADRLVRQGRANGRVLVPIVVLLAAPLALAPGVITDSPFAAVPLVAVGAALLSAANPPLDAARLDVVPPGLWGRSEGTRTFVRTLAESTAPLFFGALSTQFSGAGGTTGLEIAFLIGLAALLAAGLIALPTLRTYPRDVATASASARAASGSRTGPGPH